MKSVTVREQLQRQIDTLPDEIVQQIADFTRFVMAKRDIAPVYADWTNQQWQNFSLAQFFRDEDEVEYALEDAQEIYHP